jgi:ATP synthase, F1 epsilon subunit (delta in mitochondria)
MEQTFKLDVITPYRVFFSGQTEMIIINSTDGQLGILAGHEPVVASVAIGAGRIKVNGVWKEAAFTDGFLEIEHDRVTVLVGAAEWPEEIDVARAERSRERARERLADPALPWVVKRAEDALKRAETRLKVASVLRPDRE